MNTAGVGLADALAPEAQVIASHARAGYRRVGLVEQGRNGLVTPGATAPVTAVEHQRGEPSAR